VFTASDHDHSRNNGSRGDGACACRSAGGDLHVRSQSHQRHVPRQSPWDITLDIDPANPSEARVAATIDPTSILTDFPGDYRGTHAGTPFNSFDEALAQDANWLDAGDHPEITFQSTSVTPTGPTTATVEGNLTLKGVTRPVTLEATYNGSMAQHPGAGAGAIGFSARGTIKRSEFGITFGIPPEGSTMGVSDDIEVVIESELLQQPG
jgi:polyisoprenoid-binding protein YceI